MNPLSGYQNPTIMDDDASVYFNSPVQVANPKNALLGGIAFVLKRQIIRLCKTYDSIEELLERELDQNTKAVSIDLLKTHVMRDFHQGHGIHYPEYNVVAHSGNSVHNRPIAVVQLDGVTKFIAHSEINRMVKRV